MEWPKKIWDGLKIALLLGVFLILQDQLLGVRYDIYGHKAGLAIAGSRQSVELGQAQTSIQGALKECTFEVTRARGEIQEALLRLEDERDQILALIDTRSRQLEGELLSRMETDRSDGTSARVALEAGTARLERLLAGFAKDPEEMKRKMVLPTVQLKGNGTVGSGVIIYSEPQGVDAAGETRATATFILTAYHVVMEVLGDRVESGLVEEIHCLSNLDSAATEVVAGRLILYDRSRDVALLRLSSRRPFAEVAELMPRRDLGRIDVFSRAYAVGCPLGNRPLPTVGEISSKSKVVADQVFWMLSAPTFFGNSGGGVYAADSCQLIGISSMIYTYGKTHPAVVPHMGLFVPLEAIYRWLDGEGFGFLGEKKSIPGDLAAKCGFEEDNTATPRAASSPDQEP